MDNLFTWTMLNTLAGASALTFLVVSYTRRLIPKKLLNYIGTDIYAVVISFMILFPATWINNPPISCAKLLLAFFNSFFVAAAAAKMNDKALREAERKGKNEEPS